MERRPVEWLSAPNEDEEWPAGGLELRFRLAKEWVAVDADQIVLPITVLEKSGMTVESPYTALLKQYGGEGLLNDLLMSDQPVEEGTEWVLLRNENLLTIEELPGDDD